MKLRVTCAALLLAGCASTNAVPGERQPSVPSNGFAGADPVATKPAPPPADWWRLFGDAELDRHVLRALEANADLGVAVGNLETARAAERQARAAQLPATVIESGAGPSSAAKQPSTSSVPKTSYELGATLAYELDLFGRLASGARAARADLEASAAAHDAVRVAVAADTVSAYVDYCGAVAGARVADGQVAAQRRSLELVRRQLRAGEVSPIEVSQAAGLLAASEAAIQPFDAARRTALFRLATLQGRPPVEALAWTIGCASPPIVRTPLPVGDGASLIARRPDIREAERRLAAATARIGVATAELYPRISLGGSAGLIGGGFDAVLTPLITWAFPNQSLARARIAAARGGEAAALASWDVAILRALREVESVLAEYGAERARRAALSAAAVEAERSVARVETRYRLGDESYLPVLVAVRTRNDAAAQLAQSDLRIAQLQVALFRALGGGWEEAVPPGADGMREAT